MPDYGIRRNSEGYRDPTAFAALMKIQKEEMEQQRRVTELVKVLKYIIDKSGFELAARIELREKRTGKEYR
jgi:hypothetical protein